MTDRIRRLAAVLAGMLVAAAVPAAAQLTPSDYYLTGNRGSIPHCYGFAGVYRLSPSGALASIAVSSGRAGCAPYTRPVVDPWTNSMVTSSGYALARFDRSTDALLAQRPSTTWVSGTCSHHALGITFISVGTLMHATPDLATVTTIRGLTSINPWTAYLHGRELWSGDYIVSDGTGVLQLVSPDGSRVRRIGAYAVNTMAPMKPAVVQSHVDGDLRVFASTFTPTVHGLKRIDPRTGQSTGLPSPTAGAFCAVFEPSLGPGVIRAITMTGFDTLAPNGTTITTQPIPNGTTQWPLAQDLVRTDRGMLHARRTASPNLWTLRLEASNDIGLPYAIALSATGFAPGIRVGARTIPLVPDALFALTVRDGLRPLYTGGLGTVPASGVVTATLDLRSFGAMLSGFRIWAAAAILDPAAPHSFRRITRPEVLVLD